MVLRFLVRPVLLAAIIGFGAGPVWSASADYCTRLTSELQALDTTIASNQGGDAVAAMRRTQRELDRTLSYAKSIGCNDLRIPLLSAPRPDECARLEYQVGQMEQDLVSLKREANRGGTDLEQRRRELQSAIDTTCGATTARNGPKNLIQNLFGGAPDNLQSSEMPDDPLGAAENGLAQGFRTICVRSCDGYFFPISQFGSNGRLQADADLCHASCPGAEVNLYLQPSEKDVDSAVAVNGNTPYTALPTAFKYRTTLDPSCGCRPSDKSWADTLADAERILGANGQTDTQVTELKALELSRPRDLKVPSKGKKTDPAAQAAAASDSSMLAALQKAVPSGATIVPIKEGVVREITAPDGTKRRIRILRVPGAATVTAVE